MIELDAGQFVLLSMDRLAGVMSDDFDSQPGAPWSMHFDSVAYLMAIQHTDPKRLSYDPDLQYLHAGEA